MLLTLRCKAAQVRSLLYQGIHASYHTLHNLAAVVSCKSLIKMLCHDLGWRVYVALFPGRLQFLNVNNLARMSCISLMPQCSCGLAAFVLALNCRRQQALQPPVNNDWAQAWRPH